MPGHPRPLPPELPEVFTLTAARAAGVTIGRLRAADLECPFRGVRLRRPAPGEPGQRQDEEPGAIDRAIRRRIVRGASAYREIMPEHAFFAGRTAAVILGSGIAHDDTDLTVAVLAPRRPARRTGIHGIKISPTLAEVVTRDGLRVASAASTWAMLGGELSVRELILLGDEFVRVPRDKRGRARPEARLATIEQLRDAATAGRRHHKAKLLAALERIAVGSMSRLETDWRLDAQDAGLPEFELDVEIRDARGRLLGIADAVSREFRTIVEVEGDHHRTDRAQWQRDIEKHAAYTAAGWEVVRLTSRHIRIDRSAAGILRAVLIRRGWRP